MSGARLDVAVDAGQTSTRAATLDGRGAVGRATSVPRGVVHLGRRAGPARSAAAVAHAVAACADGAPVRSIRVGLSGYSRAERQVDRFLARLAGLTGAEDVWAASDAVTAFLGALGPGAGLIVVAGTGGVVLATDASGVCVTVGGHGYLLGETFGAYAIGALGLRTALDGTPSIGGSDGIAAAARDHFGDLGSVQGRLYAMPSPIAKIAGFAPALSRLAREGDPAAIQVWRAVVDRTASAIALAAGRLGSRLPVIRASWSGGLFDTKDLFLEPLLERVPSLDGRIRFAEPSGAPLAGAAALDQAAIRLFPYLVRRSRFPA